MGGYKHKTARKLYSIRYSSNQLILASRFHNFNQRRALASKMIWLTAHCKQESILLHKTARKLYCNLMLMVVDKSAPTTGSLIPNASCAINIKTRP